MQYPASNTETGMDREDRATFKGVDDLLPDLKYLLPRCDSEITMRKALAETAQRFCRNTGAFEYQAEIAVVDGQRRYALPVCDVNADLLSVKQVDVWQAPAGETEARFCYTLRPTSYAVYDPIDDDLVYLDLADGVYGGSGTVTTLRVTMGLIPLFDQNIGTQAYALPDKFLRRWRQALVTGAAMSLAGMDGRPWSNAGLASSMREQYFELVCEAKNKADYNRMAEGSASCGNPIGFV